MLSLPMRARRWIVTALAVAGLGAWGGAEEPARKGEERVRKDRFADSIEFIVGASMGSVADPNVRKFAGNRIADNERDINILGERLRAEADRILPSADRLDSLRTLYPRVNDLAPFERDRAALAAEVEHGCNTLIDGTVEIKELFKGSIAGGLPDFMARGKSREAGSYVRLMSAYQRYQEIRAVRFKVCQTLLDERAAFSRRQEELQQEAERRSRLRWYAVAAAALVAVAAWLFLRRRRSLAQRAWVAVALVVAGAAWSRADEPEPSGKGNKRAERVEGGVDFFVRAMTGSISNPNIQKLAGGSITENEDAINAVVQRLQAEKVRVMPSIDRLDALRASYPKADDLSRFENGRAALCTTVGAVCRTFVTGTDKLHELIQAQLAAGLPGFVAKGAASDSGAYVRLWRAYHTYEELVRVRGQICRVTTDESSAFIGRQEELRQQRARRERRLWAGAAAAAVAVIAAFAFWRSRRSAERVQAVTFR